MSSVATYLLMLFHSRVEFLREVIGYIRHPRLFLVGSTDAALVFVSFLIIFLFGILAVCMGSLKIVTHKYTEGGIKSNVLEQSISTNILNA